MQTLSRSTDIKTVLTTTVNTVSSDITNFINHRMDKYYHEIQCVDDFDIRMIMQSSMMDDIISKIISCGKMIVDAYRNIANPSIQISENIYQRFSFLIESGYASLCISETDDCAKNIIYSMIDNIQSFLLLIETQQLHQ